MSIRRREEAVERLQGLIGQYLRSTALQAQWCYLYSDVSFPIECIDATTTTTINSPLSSFEGPPCQSQRESESQSLSILSIEPQIIEPSSSQLSSDIVFLEDHFLSSLATLSCNLLACDSLSTSSQSDPTPLF